MNKYLILAVALLLIGVGGWYFIQEKTLPIEPITSGAEIMKINWDIEMANPQIVDENDYRKYAQSIFIDVIMTDKTSRRYNVGDAYGCTGSNTESQEDGYKVFGKVSCYFALSSESFVAFSRDGKFLIERRTESAKDGSIEKTVVLEL